jgi:hypothetical protein
MDSGLDLPLLVYNRLVGRPLPPLTTYRKGVRAWYPIEDYRAFRRIRRQGQLSLRQWLNELAHRKTLPYFRWSDTVADAGRSGTALPAGHRRPLTPLAAFAAAQTRKFLTGSPNKFLTGSPNAETHAVADSLNERHATSGSVAARSLCQSV